MRSGTVVLRKGSWKAWQFVSLPLGRRKGPRGVEDEAETPDKG